MALTIMVGRAVGSSSRHALHLEAVACSWDELWGLSSLGLAWKEGLPSRQPRWRHSVDTMLGPFFFFFFWYGDQGFMFGLFDIVNGLRPSLAARCADVVSLSLWPVSGPWKSHSRDSSCVKALNKRKMPARDSRPLRRLGSSAC